MGDFIVHRARFFDFQPKAIQSMSYDDNLKKLAISRSDNTIEIWCTTNELLESIIVPASDRQVEVVLWCRSQLLSAGLDGFIVFYDLARLTAKKLVPSIGGAIWCMTRNKSETKIVVGTEDGYVVLYELQLDGILFEKSFNKQESRILSIAWHRDEDVLVTGGIDNIRVWDVNTGQVMQRISLGRVDKNKETLVWCLAITSNMHIISGDSRGKVCVWNAEQATLIKSFQTHSVDVLCLCIDESEKHIYCSGIDPCIVKLDYVTVSESESFKAWIKSSVYYNHTHDVRSILIANNQLISAGVDTKVVFKNIVDKQSSPSIRKYNSMPQKRLVDICEDFVLLQYDTHLELWKLGETPAANSDPAAAAASALDGKRDGDPLPILRLPRKFVHLKSKNDLPIVCSSIGSHPANHNSSSSSSSSSGGNNKKPNSNNASHVLWLSYSDLNVIHIYRVEIGSKQLLEPKIQIDKIKSLPLACGNRPAVLMKFYSHSNNSSSVGIDVASNSQLRLCYLTNKSCVQCLKLVNDEIGFMLESSIQCVPQDLLLTDNRVYLMAFKDDFAATVDTDHNVSVWSLKTNQQMCTLPRYDYLTACLAFHPKRNCLLVCYANRKIVEYDFEQEEYTEWSRETSDKFPKQWFKLHNKLLNCFYDCHDSSSVEKIVVHDEQYLAVINKSEKMPSDPNVKILHQTSLRQASASSTSTAASNGVANASSNGESNGVDRAAAAATTADVTMSESGDAGAGTSALHISNKFRYIIYANQPAKGQLLVVEVTPLSVTERLPPSLKQKKFGT